jgi:hypothetical protein
MHISNSAYRLAILFAVTLGLLSGCTSEAEELKQQRKEDSTRAADSMRAMFVGDSVRIILEMLWKDSVQKKIHALIDSSFEFKHQDFEHATYYHKNWWGTYYLRAEALTCVLHQSGELMLVSCLDGQDAGCAHNQIAVEVNGKEFTSDTAFAKPPSLIIGAGHSEFALFTGEKAWNIAHAIRENPKANIVVRARNNSGFCSRYILSTRDIEGISDCYDLGTTMRTFYEYGAQ